MENRILDDSYNATNQNGLSNMDKDYLFTAAKWAGFLGIVGFVMSGLLAVAAFFISSLMNAFGGMAAMQGSRGAASIGSAAGAFITIFYLGFAVLGILYASYMYNFGTKTKAAILSNDSELLTEGFKNLKSMFRFSGILTAIVLGFYAVLIVFSLIGVAIAGVGMR
jgi:hypothetical protein